MALTAAALARFEFSQMHMGVAIRLTLFAQDRAIAEWAGRAAFLRFSQLDAMMSDYQTESELSRLCRHAGSGPVVVSPELFEVLQFADRVSSLTDGAFDVTAAPVVRLWRAARQTGSLPTAASIEAAVSLVDYHRVHLDPSLKTVSLDPGTTLDLGGIAKGFACDEALAALSNAGIDRAMVEAGGDIVVSGAPPVSDGWRVAVENVDHPPFVLVNQALSTSSDSEQFIEIGGLRYSHIVDPETGLGLTGQRQITVIGRRGLWTDPIATAESIKPGCAAGLALGLEVFRT